MDKKSLYEQAVEQSMDLRICLHEFNAAMTAFLSFNTAELEQHPGALRQRIDQLSCNVSDREIQIIKLKKRVAELEGDLEERNRQYTLAARNSGNIRAVESELEKNDKFVLRAKSELAKSDAKIVELKSELEVLRSKFLGAEEKYDALRATILDSLQDE